MAGTVSPAFCARLLTQISMSADVHNASTISNKKLAAQLGSTTRSVEYGLAILREREEITLSYDDERNRTIWLI